jgi:hypothetical protein
VQWAPTWELLYGVWIVASGLSVTADVQSTIQKMRVLKQLRCPGMSCIRQSVCVEGVKDDVMTSSEPY